MAGTEVITGRMLEVAKNVEELISRYNTSVNRVYQIGGEVDAMWDGEASRKFQVILGNDRERFNAMTRLLTEYVQVLRQDANIYARTEGNVIDILNTNKIR